MSDDPRMVTAHGGQPFCLDHGLIFEPDKCSTCRTLTVSVDIAIGDTFRVNGVVNEVVSFSEQTGLYGLSIARGDYDGRTVRRDVDRLMVPDDFGFLYLTKTELLRCERVEARVGKDGRLEAK